MPRDESTFAEDVRRGLTSVPKQVPPKYFYDELGSALFDAICALPEYYVTRAETEIFRTQGANIAAEFGAPVRLIELGCGNAKKTRILFDAILAEQPSLDYVGVDIDPTVVASLQRDLSRAYPAVRMTPVAHDFRDIRQILAPVVPRGDGVRNVVLFIGSTIGNLPPSEADEMLSAIRTLLDPGDALLVGTDLVKPKGILEEAYDDPTGVTAAFNLNVLGRMNRELSADFNLRSFRHRAFYNDAEARIEMHVVSEIAQCVHIGAIGLKVDFTAGETIHTENSYKFDEVSIASMAARAGFRVQRSWLDSRGWFSDTLLAAV